MLGKLTNKVLLERLYLDYNATSPLSNSVKDWLKSGEVLFANPASQHSSGKAARKSINDVRRLLFSTFNKKETDTKLFFHSGATEAFGTFMHSFSESTRLQKQRLLVCFSGIDHPAITSLKERFWGEHVEFCELKMTQDLQYSHDENFAYLIQQKKADPGLVIMYHHLWVHNETGFVADLGKLKKFKEITDLFIHVDAVQAPGKVSEWQNLEVGDIWSFSAHKFGSLKGVGFSFMRSIIPFCPLISGGGQQFGLRSGTENVQGVISVGLALNDLLKIDPVKNGALRDDLENFLKKELQGIGTVIDSPSCSRASNTLYFFLHDLTSDLALALFDLHGLEVSAGSACSSGAAKASSLLLYKGLNQYARNGLRISLGFLTSEDEIRVIKSKLSQVFQKLKSS